MHLIFILIYINICVTRVWEWAIELHPILPSAAASKSGWYENDGKLSSITMTKKKLSHKPSKSSFITPVWLFIGLSNIEVEVFPRRIGAHSAFS